MGHGEEHGQSDRRRVEQCYHPCVPLGVPLGSGDVRGRNGDSLAADQLETAVPSGVQRHAVVADGHRGMRGDCGHLPIRLGRDAAFYIFSVLTI